MQPMNPPARGPVPQGPTPGAPGGPTPKSVAGSQRQTRIYLMVAVLLAVIAAVAVLVFGGPKNSGVWVYQANQTIQPRTQLSAKMFTPVEVPATSLVQGSYRAASAEELASQVDFRSERFAQYLVERGSQLTRSMVSGPVKLDKALAPDERLIAISANVADTVAGAIKVGDHVDLYATGNVGDRQVSRLVLANAEIISVAPKASVIESAADRQAAEGSAQGATSRSDYLPTDAIPGTYILKVKSTMVGRLMLLNKQGGLFMAYRAPNATTDLPAMIDSTQALCAPTDVAEGAATTPAPADGCPVG